jgi:ribosomal protein S12 methylthiotransferase accessory factor
MWKFHNIKNYPKSQIDDSWATVLLNDSRIVKSYNKNLRFYDEPFLYRFSAVTADTHVFNDVVPGVDAGGTSFDLSVALCKCAGEAAERFCLATIPNESLSRGTFATQAPSLNPDDFRFFSPSQLSTDVFKLFKWNDESSFLWSNGFDLTRQRATKIPAQLVYVSELLANEQPLIHPTTSGGACAKTFEESVLSGMLELLERDAFMIHYLSKSEGIRIDFSNSPLFREIELYLTRFDLEIQTYLLQTDFPVCPVMAILIDKSRSGIPAPWFSSGLKCSLDPTRALIGAIEESCQTRPWIRTVLQDLEQGIGASREERISDIFIDRAIFWSEEKRMTDLSFLTASRRSIKFEDLNPISSSISSGGLDLLTDFCSTRGHPVYAVDITAPEVREHGLTVTKVIMPTLQHFYLNEPHIPLASTRWREVPSLLGLREDLGQPHNPTPHFFL